MMKTVLSLSLLALAGTALAAPVTYQIDPDHTFPAFETDHMGGLSVWRGKFAKTSGQVVMDKEAGTGTVDITIDAASIDLAHEKLEQHVRGSDMFDVEKFPTATYKGKLVKFKDGAPTEVEGQLTLHGVHQAGHSQDQSFPLQEEPHERQGRLRRRRLGDHRPLRLRHRLRQGLRFQARCQIADLDRGRPRQLIRAD